jgi:hypothetical protein
MTREDVAALAAGALVGAAWPMALIFIVLVVMGRI